MECGTISEVIRLHIRVVGRGITYSEWNKVIRTAVLLVFVVGLRQILWRKVLPKDDGLEIGLEKHKSTKTKQY